MSRNVRRKPTTPVKATKNRRRRISDTSTSSIDLSDDGGYSAVEEISDSSDDDEEDVAAAEEESILKETSIPTPIAPRPQVSDDEEDEADDENDDDDDGGIEVDDDETGSWGGIMSDVEEDQTADFFQDATAFDSDMAIERHVHFDVPSSDSSSTETDDDDHGDMFPDIFISQTALDPAFRREIEDDPDDDSSVSGSFWDFNYQYGDNAESDAEEIVRQFPVEEDPFGTPMASQAPTAASTPTPAFEEPQGLNSSDDSEGDTTEEEDEPEPIIRRKARRSSNSMSEMSDSEADSPVKIQRGQPRLGRYDTHRSDGKPIAVYNTRTRKMIIFTPNESRQLDLSPEQFNLPWPDEATSPILSNPAHMMFSAMLSANTFGDFVNGQAMGPAEAFFSFDANTADESSTASIQDDEDELEKQLDINDFIAWDEDSSDDEGEGNWEPSSTPMRPTTANSDCDVLSHLNSETVGAFRRNQINQQLILSNQATQDSLAFSGPYNYTALKGIRTDRFDTAAVPLTPVRRHKKHLSEQAKSPLDSVSVKRKASGEVGGGHKRHRSISDVGFLNL